MSQDSGIPPAADREPLEHDRTMRVTERLHELKLQGAKGLGALNGAAAVAVLAFVQALAGQKTLAPFKPFAIASLALFLAGAFLAAIAFFFQHAYISRAFARSERHEWWHGAYWCLLVVTAGMAFVGGAIVVVGIGCAL